MTLLAIKWNQISPIEAYVEVLDQLLLPFSFEYIKVKNTNDGWGVINKMQVRGAPAIAITACLSLAAELVNGKQFKDKNALHVILVENLEFLVTARPTAVNIKIVKDALISFSEALILNVGMSKETHKERIIKWCIQMLENDIIANRHIGKFGREHILSNTNKAKVTLLTHCNTGSLATAGYGTALGVIRSCHENNSLEHVYCCETRPYNQGARLTAFELVYEKIPATLICDNMVGALMCLRSCDAVVVGADRIAKNGDTANKIGTYQIAILARFHNIPLYVCADKTTIDLSTENGNGIVIEERNSDELTCIAGQRIAAPGIRCWNPAFDVTPAHLITGIITDKGVFKPIDLSNILQM